MRRAIFAAVLAASIAGGGASQALASDPAVVTKPTFNAGTFYGANITVDHLPVVSVEVTGVQIAGPTDPHIPPNPVRPVIQVTSLLHD